jgi:hypothetical protein
LLVKLVVDFSSFYADGIESRRGEGFDWARGLRVNHSNPEKAEIARISTTQAKREGYQKAFSEQPQASFFRHKVEA